MNSYEIVESERSAMYIALYIIVLTILFFLGKAMTAFFLFLFPGDLFLWMNENMWPAVGVLNITIFLSSFWNRMYRNVEGGQWLITINDIFNQGHWFVYPAGKHFGSIFETEFKKLPLFKKEYTHKNQKVSTKDDDVTVDSFLTVEPINPLFVLLDRNKPEDTAINLAVARVELYNEKYASKYTSDQIIGNGPKMSAKIQSYLDKDTSLIHAGIQVKVSIKKIDFSKDVSDSRSQRKLAHAFRESVNELAGVKEFIRHPDTGEILYDKDGKPLMTEPDITREEAAAILLVRDGKDSRFDRNKDERIIRLEGTPELIELAKRTGILFGAGGEEHQNKI